MTLQQLALVLDEYDHILIRYGKQVIDTTLDRALFEHELDEWSPLTVTYIGTLHKQGKTYICIELE